MINFDALSDQAYRRPVGETATREDQTNLWKAFFALEHWLFVVDASKPLAGDTKPFVGYIEEQPWFFVFTDSERASQFAKKFELADATAGCLYITMTPESALKFLASAKDHVHGIRVNEGEHGWFAPMDNLPAIYHYLITQNLLKL